MPHNFPAVPEGCWRFKQEKGEWYFLTIIDRNEEIVTGWVSVERILNPDEDGLFDWYRNNGFESTIEVYKIYRDDLCSVASTEWARKACNLKKSECSGKCDHSDPCCYSEWWAYEGIDKSCPVKDAQYHSNKWRDFTGV
jgi:hypothetical protein